MNKIKSRLKAFERVSHLTLKQKAELCEMSMKPNFNKEKICKDYGIHRTTLNRILQKKDIFLNCEKETF